MKKNVFLITVILFCTSSILIGQKNENVDDILGKRIVKNGKDYLIYTDANLEPNFSDYRKLNYRFFFRLVDFPIYHDTVNNRRYQLITIPGKIKEGNQSKNESSMAENYPRAGKSIDKVDYDQNFWIDVDILEDFCEVVHYKYSNDVFSGLLTAPFKYRLKAGSSPESFLDGGFNIAPFFGWKFRMSSSRPFFFSPFIFSGITTLSYSAADNTSINDASVIENGSGIVYGGGITFRFGSISPGLILGYDHGLGNLGKGFKYSDKPWISFSISYDFFEPKQNAVGSKQSLR